MKVVVGSESGRGRSDCSPYVGDRRHVACTFQSAARCSLRDDYDGLEHQNLRALHNAVFPSACLLAYALELSLAPVAPQASVCRAFNLATAFADCDSAVISSTLERDQV